VELGALILTGGASSRMGADKAAIPWLGIRAVDRVADLAARLGAAPVFTVGAEDYGHPFVADEPRLGGPVGGVMAGAARLRAAGCARALVLAVDAPTIRPEDLALLLGAEEAGAAFAELHVPMVIALAAIPTDVRADWPIARLVERAGLLRPSCPAGARPRLRGANTPAEQDALLAELVALEAAQKGGAG
jgi:molybdopterin-guanine dinucleotide biosynthesis protein A